MSPAIVVVSGALLGLAVLLVVAGLVPRERQAEAPSSPGVRTRLRRAVHTVSRRQQVIGAAAVLGGLAAFAWTGWLLALVIVPLAVWGLPILLAEPPNRDIDLLQALDRWVRGLASSIPTGKSITDAIRATRGQAPPLIAGDVRLLVARLDERWTTAEALLAFADELDSPDSDAVVASLSLAAERGGVGATQTLTALSENIQERLRALREIEAERAKPRAVVKQITLITVLALTAALLTGGSFFDPYRTPIGQLAMLGLASAYAGSLIMLRRRTMPRRRERILQRRSRLAVDRG
ncbi:MAG TPA: type II secretion system F family protein [Propionibacteriaceae bacterium]|nr:type II secretion system F family protein [Propionibacteriaceae bacterium]